MKTMMPPGVQRLKPSEREPDPRPPSPPNPPAPPTAREEAKKRGAERSSNANKKAKEVYASAGRELTELDVRIGERLRMIRKENGLSLMDVGARLNLAYQQVQKYENGTNRISASMLYRLAALYKRPVDYFFVGIEDQE